MPEPLAVYSAAADRYEKASYARVGRSGLKLPEISLGLWNNFGDDRPIATQRAILRRAFDLGVTHFDLANNYGPPAGSAEKNFGRIFAEDFRPHRDELIVSSKAGYEQYAGPYGDWGSRKYLLASLDASLTRTGLDYFDIFGYTHERRTERALVEEYRAAIGAVVAHLGSHASPCLELARLPQQIRGYGHVKARAVAAARARQAELFESITGKPLPPGPMADGYGKYLEYGW